MVKNMIKISFISEEHILILCLMQQSDLGKISFIIFFGLFLICKRDQIGQMHDTK